MLSLYLDDVFSGNCFGSSPVFTTVVQFQMAHTFSLKSFYKKVIGFQSHVTLF